MSLALPAWRRPTNHAALRALPIALAAILALASCLVHAARPMITDDASIVDPKSCQFEGWTMKKRASTGYWGAPACNFSGNLELSVGGARAHDATGTRATDALIQGKTLLEPLETNGWGVGLAIGAQRHLRSARGGADWYVNVPASFSFRDDRFLLHANLGWLREQETRHHHLTWGLGSETRLGGGTTLIAETFGQNQGRPLFQIGLSQSIVPGRAQIFAAYGNRMGGGTQERWFSIGVRLLTMPFLP